MRNRAFQILLLASLASGPVLAQPDPFVGQWKLTKFTDQMSVTQAGANTYVFNFEGGGPEKIVADGSFQSGIGGTELSVAPDGPNWKVVRMREGRKILTATWTLSKDGNSLTDDVTSFDKSGRPSNITSVFTRVTTGSRFTGTWVSTSSAIDSVTILQIRPYKSGGLSLSVPSEDLAVNLTFDGENVRRIDARRFEITRKANGKITQTEEYVVSSDLKTLTREVRVVGETHPLITVFERL